MSDENPPYLGSTRSDDVVLALKSAAALVPIAGGYMGELITSIIPGQRLDRIVRYIELLNERLAGVEQSVLESKFRDPKLVDIFEDALSQAVRATSQERLEYLADVVANGIKPEDIDHAQVKRMLWLLGQLSDEEVIILRARLCQTNEDYRADAAFHDLHSHLLKSTSLTLGADDDEREEAALLSSYRRHLSDLGLTRRKFRKPKKNELPEFDYESGTLAAQRTEVTRLGRMLLEHLELLPTWYRG